MIHDKRKKRVLFVCTGNSCRSQMAEGLVRELLGGRWEPASAGTAPEGYVSPYAIQVMQELGIDIRGQRSKSVDEFRDADFDLVVTVCDEAAERCPSGLGSAPAVHLGFPDPALATGSPEEILAVYREVRDAIKEYVPPLLAEMLDDEDVTGPGAAAPADALPAPFRVPARHNRKLASLLDAINADAELRQLWRCANVNAVDRSGISDHGEIHIRIVANAALKILRLLVEAGITPSIVQDHSLTVEDAEVVVVLAACLHDVGIAVHRQDHEHLSLVLAYPKARQLLSSLYDEPALTTMVAEVLHAIGSHRWDVTGLTLEAGVIQVADALDMTEGRSRIPFEAGQVNIHSISAQAIDAVSIDRGVEHPVCVEIKMSNSAGIFQVDELLKRKLKNSTLAPYVEVVACIEGETERRLIEVYTI